MLKNSRTKIMMTVSLQFKEKKRETRLKARRVYVVEIERKKMLGDRLGASTRMSESEVFMGNSS